VQSLSDEIPKKWWKFAVKAAYIKVVILAACMEFKSPKALMLTFALPTIKTIVEKLMPSSDAD
jgi:hypothetical protein